MELQNSPRLQQYARCLAIATKKVEEKELARQDISKQISKIKKHYERNVKEETFQKALEKLEAQVAELMQKQRVSVEISPKEKVVIQQLRERISELQDKIDKTASLIEDNERKMHALAESIFRVNKKIADLKTSDVEEKTEEEKIEKTLALDEGEIKQIEEHLKMLEQKYEELKKTGKYSEESLAPLKNRIELNKEKLKKIKNRS